MRNGLTHHVVRGRLNRAQEYGDLGPLSKNRAVVVATAGPRSPHRFDLLDDKTIDILVLRAYFSATFHLTLVCSYFFFAPVEQYSRDAF
jgi:hypothetical protein